MIREIKLLRIIRILVFVLIIFGIVAILSVSAPVQFKNDNTIFGVFIKWTMYILIGIVLAYTVEKYILQQYIPNMGVSWIMVLFCFFALLAPVFFGRPINGAYRWISIAGFGLQPSELMKPLFIVILATQLHLKRKNNIILINLLIIIGLVIIAMKAERSNTSSLQYILIAYLMYIISEAKEKHKFMLTAIGAAFVFIAFLLIKINGGYAYKRITEFLGTGSEQAIAANKASIIGGINGLGIGEGMQKYFFLSEAHTDYIFSAISEETGLIGALIVIIIFAVLIVSLFKLSSLLRNDFCRYLAYGVSFNITNQAILHIAINLKLLPATGITLPFISYGGSSLIANLISIGILQYAVRKDLLMRII